MSRDKKNYIFKMENADYRSLKTFKCMKFFILKYNNQLLDGKIALMFY